MIGICSAGIWRLPGLAAMLGTPVCRLRRGLPAQQPLQGVAGWGLRPTARRAQRLANQLGVPYYALEDAFLRSVGLGVQGHPPLGLVVDELGIYYDASRPSRLEKLIQEQPMSSQRQRDAERAMALIRLHGLSKYNHAPAMAPLTVDSSPRILLVDQTEGDVSVVAGGANAESFRQMLAAARKDFPHATLWLKLHPDVIAGKKKGFLQSLPHDPKLRLLVEDVAPLSLLQQMDVVYTVSSHMGFEALMLGKQVVCFGLPWYAGWGLTNDRHPKAAALQVRRGQRSLCALFAAAYFDYSRYRHPVSGLAANVFDIIDWLARNKAANDRLRGNNYCVGLSLWKRAVLKPFLSHPSSRLHFVADAVALRRQLRQAPGRVVVWGMGRPDVQDTAAEFGAPLLRLEDGFIRSVGLGSNLRAPSSLALDEEGLYYATQHNNRLCRLLDGLRLDAAQLERAGRLAQQLSASGISKYNVGRSFSLPAAAAGRKVILVPGQVEDDASLQYGAGQIRRNVDLLQLVRRLHPEAWLVYKPHPDVVSGNRRGQVDSTLLSQLADQVAAEAAISACLPLVDEVHTMTSLAGFEALLYGKAVHCYGMPFYGGWGLTCDHAGIARSRQLSLAELVHGVLVSYPAYCLPGVPGWCAVEDVVCYLGSQLRQGGSAQLHASWTARQWRKAMYLLAALLRR